MNIWGTVPDWFAAIGTIGATATALWLAKRGARPAISVFMTPAWKETDEGRVLIGQVTVTYHGNSQLSVTSVQLRIGWGRGIIVVGHQPEAHALEHGQMYQGHLDLEFARTRLAGVGRWSTIRLALKRVRIWVFLSNGKLFRYRPREWELGELLKSPARPLR